MKGKAGLVVGFAIGYVLGSRAGRERYEQIKAQWLKAWNAEPVQAQVAKVKDFTKSKAMALPTTLWGSAVKVAQAAGAKGTPGQKLDAAIRVGKDSADDVETAAQTSAEAVTGAVDDTIDDAVDNAVDDAPENGRGGA